MIRLLLGCHSIGQNFMKTEHWDGYSIVIMQYNLQFRHGGI